MLETKDKVIVVLISILLIVTIIAVAYVKTTQDEYNKKITILNATIAASSPTVKIDDTTYRKLIQEQNNILDSYLKEKDKALYDKIDKMGSQIIGITNAQIKIKDEIVNLKGKKDGVTSTTVLMPDGTRREAVEFSRNLWKNFLNLSGRTVSATPTLEAETKLELKQLKPFNIKVAILKDKDGKWETIMSLPDFPDNEVVVDGRVDLNPIIEEYSPHWYNNFYLGMPFYVGRTGLVTGVSVGYKFFGKLLLAPAIVVNSNAELFYGLNAFYNIAGR